MVVQATNACVLDIIFEGHRNSNASSKRSTEMLSSSILVMVNNIRVEISIIINTRRISISRTIVRDLIPNSSTSHSPSRAIFQVEHITFLL